MSVGTVDDDMVQDRAIREQAVRLTQATFLKISPKPQRSVEKVAPVVYALLIDGVDPETIAQALTMARAHTPDGISYALRQILPPIDTTAPRPAWRPYEPIPFDPSPADRAAAHRAIAEARAVLHGGERSAPA
jgi:hypothetical protein